MEPITFSQASLLAFLTCRRRFQLRHLERLSWPYLPFSPEQRSAIEQGQMFHLLLERFFLGMPIGELAIPDDQLKTWWQRFEDNVLPLPKGRILPELRLTVPAGDHFLTGRFDLAIINDDEAQCGVHVYDWKTSRPQTVEELEKEWQSKLYLALLAESKSALTAAGEVLRPDQIMLSYWYVTDPQTARTISYSQKKHDDNWAEILSVISEVDSCLKHDEWPLTDNWSHCRTCAYGTYCGRLEGGAADMMLVEDAVEYEFDPFLFLEPESP